MEPQQRVFLEVGHSALCASGWKQPFHAKNAGVFVGACGGEFREAASISTVGPYTATGTHAALISGRFSYIFGL